MNKSVLGLSLLLSVTAISCTDSHSYKGRNIIENGTDRNVEI